MKQELKRRRLEPDLIFSTKYDESIHHSIQNQSYSAQMAKYGRSEDDILNNILGEYSVSTGRSS